jgi:acyl-CoA thioesterase II
MARVSQEAVGTRCRLLDLEPIGVDIFRGVPPEEDRPRVVGGQVAGRALAAASRTAERGLGRGRSPRPTGAWP